MNSYTYRTWGGGTRRVEAARVEFAPEHVIFRDNADRIVVAEKNVNVNELRQTNADNGERA